MPALYASNQARLAALAGWLHYYNCHRPHTALDGRSFPMQVSSRLGDVW